MSEQNNDTDQNWYKGGVSIRTYSVSGIVMVTNCTRCGAVVSVEKDGEFMVAHNDWHAEQERYRKALELSVEATTKLAKIVEGLNGIVREGLKHTRVGFNLLGLK